MIEAIAERLRQNVSRVIVGQQEAIELVLVTLLCRGHVLIEDVPGIGKTTLARCIARSLGCTFRRIQCTPDLLPSDVTGLYIYNQRDQAFDFRPGPVFTQVLLVDEINRATPRTQSALLEAMQELQVTLEGETHALPRPFIVLATQNPIELEGTFPLPEAQLDRFLMRIALGYPSSEQEHEILLRFQAYNPLEELDQVATPEELLSMQRAVRQTRVERSVREYLVNVIRKTREHPAVSLGASPRASLALFHASQALAAIRSRDYVLPDDVKYLAPYVLTHRLLLDPQVRLRGRTAADIVRQIVTEVPVPVEEI
jgi:MoxR-like ATPase